MTTRRLSMLALAASLAALVTVMLITPLQAEAAPEPKAQVVRYATIPTAAFQPVDDNVSFTNQGYALGVLSPSSSGWFIAPLFFEDSRVTVTNLTLYAYDNNGDANICLSLHRASPANGGTPSEQMGMVCSSGTGSVMRTFNISGWDYQAVYGNHGPYLLVYLPGTNIEGFVFHGARVTYTYTP